MKSLNRLVDRFCYRHPGFGVPGLMLFISIGTAIMYVFMMMDTTGMLSFFLPFSPQLILEGQLWRLVTFVFVPPATSLIFIFFTLYFYYFIGSTLERQWGKGRFTIFYLSGVLLTLIYGFVAGLGFGIYFPISVHYINMSLFFSFATLFPDTRVRLFFVIPVKIKWLGWLNAAYFAYEVAINLINLNFIGALLPIVAIINYLVFCGEPLLESFGILKSRVSPQTINFKRAVKQAQKRGPVVSQRGPLSRSCAVCGRSESEHPELEFRYCSRCSGYHCFCSDHINSHIHFTE